MTDNIYHSAEMGKVISPIQFSQLNLNPYLYTEEGEKLFFAIKSKNAEYGFTNYGFLHLDAYSQQEAKFIIHRYLFEEYPLLDVGFKESLNENASSELSFRFGEFHYNLQVEPKFTAYLIELFKTLSAIAHRSARNQADEKFLNQTMQQALHVLNIQHTDNRNTVGTIIDLIQELEMLRQKRLDKIRQRDYTELFEIYLTKIKFNY